MPLAAQLGGHRRARPAAAGEMDFLVSMLGGLQTDDGGKLTAATIEPATASQGTRRRPALYGPGIWSRARC